MALYKLTKGTLSRIRKDKAGCDELIEQGYVFDGEVDENFNPVVSIPEEEKDSLSDLREEAVGLGLAPSIAERLKTKKAIQKKIDELKEGE